MAFLKFINTLKKIFIGYAFGR